MNFIILGEMDNKTQPKSTSTNINDNEIIDLLKKINF